MEISNIQSSSSEMKHNILSINLLEEAQSLLYETPNAKEISLSQYPDVKGHRDCRAPAGCAMFQCAF